MLSFKQYLIEKTQDTKYGGMNVPLDLADFPDNDSGSMISPVNFAGSTLTPVRYTRTDRDAYDAALKIKNDKILANNKKYGLSDEIDETPFEEAFSNSRKYIESMVMDPDNKDGNPRSPQDMSQSRSASNTRVDNRLPDLGEKGLVGSILNPDNPLDAGSLHTDLLRQVKDKGTQVSQAWNNFSNFLGSNDPLRYALSKNYRERAKLDSPMWKAHNEAGEKEARNTRLGVTPSVVNPNPPENYHDSQDYFDRITGIANTLYNDNQMFLDKENQKLSPFDMISLQFGKDKTKERNDFLAQQKDYLENDDQAKLARTYADLRDPKHDETMLYKPLEIQHHGKDGPRFFDPPQPFSGRTSIKYPALYTDATNRVMAPYMADTPEDFVRVYDNNDHGTMYGLKGKEVRKPQSTFTQRAEKAVDDQMRRTPRTFETTIDMNKDNIEDWEQYIATLNHEGQHASTTNTRTVADLANYSTDMRKLDAEYRSPSWLKYGIVPSIDGTTMGSGYEELEQRGILDSWKLNDFQKGLVQHDIETMDDKIYPQQGVEYKGRQVPGNYFWSRAEMPAFMTDIKGKILKSTGTYPKSDQTDEQIEQDRAKMYKLIQDNGLMGDVSTIKALEMMKTPEGKAIYRGVEKTSPKQDRRYA